MDFYLLTPSQFEDMCYEYAQNIYSSKEYVLYHTHYSHDGGRDLEINFYDQLHRYKIWAECKQHKRDIGLEEIGKNVVLIIARRINKVIFFSASKIRKNSKTEILRIGKRMNFDVCFLDDENLKSELEKYPDLVNKYFTNYKNNSININSPKMQVFLSEDNDSYSENKKVFYLREGKTFNVNILIKNMTKNYYSNVNIDWLDENDDIKIIDYNEEDDLPNELLPLTDYLITYLCQIKTLKYEEIELPNLILNYSFGTNDNYLEVILPKLNLTRYIVHPLNGKKYLEFLYNDIEKVIIKSKTGLFQLISIEGKSGCGKSRIINETKTTMIKNKYLYLTFDSYDYDELDIFRKIICDIIDIPYKHKNILYNQSQLEQILISSQISKEASEIISEFIFNKKISIDKVNYISQYISLLIEKISKTKNIFIAIDNIQNNNQIFFDIIKDLIISFEKINCNIILVTALNTERITDENSATIVKYRKFIENKKSIKPNQFISFYPVGFEDDITVFWMETLNRHNPKDNLVQCLIKKFGDNPLEVTTVADYLKQNLILKQMGNEEWYISKHIEFQKILESTFLDFQVIFKKRILAIFSQYPSHLLSMKEIISTLILFNNSIGAYNLSRIVNSPESINILRTHSIIKLIDGKYSFYHDSIYSYFIEEIEYVYIMIDQVYNFLLENKELDEMDLIYFNIYYYKNDVKKYAELALSILKKYFENFRYIQAIEFGKKLYNNNCFKKENIMRYLQCARLYALACSLSGSKDTSCSIFLNLYPLFVENQNTLKVDEVCNFFRDAINSQLQSNRFENALEVLEAYKNISSKPQEHEFMLYNREAVTYLSLNRLNEAKIAFQTSLSIAESLKINSKFWTSTTYSDIALMYFYSKGSQKNKENTIKYLNLAIDDYDDCFDETIYRKNEILWHKAMINVLEGDYDLALEILTKDKEHHKNNYSIYEQFRFKNLIALCKLYNGDLYGAIDDLKDIKAECEVKQHSAAIVRINNNLGVVYMQLKDYEKADEHFNLAYSEIMNDKIHLKMYPVVSNYLHITKILGKSTENIFNKALQIPDPQFQKYCKRVITNSKSKEFSWTLWNFNGVDYIF
ncbi:MAG: restriction endonuclease [Longibaculum sp.]